MATEPMEKVEYEPVVKIREFISAPVNSQNARTVVLYGVAAALISLAPLPFGPLGAFCIAVLAAERKK